jgi:hypothetical protein
MGVYVGIDPGKKGAFVAVNGNEQIIAVEKNVTGDDLFTFLSILNPRHVFLEKAQSMPRQGIASAFNYGQGYGELIGVLTARAVPYTLVRPSYWTKALHVGTADGEPKERSAEAFRRLYPREPSALTPRGKLHDGVVDATLIAVYGLRHIITKFRGETD